MHVPHNVPSLYYQGKDIDIVHVHGKCNGMIQQLAHELSVFRFFSDNFVSPFVV